MELEECIKKHGFVKGVKIYMELDFLKDLPLEKINEFFIQIHNKNKELESKVEKLKKDLNNEKDISLKLFKENIKFEDFIKHVHKESLVETDWCMNFMHKLLGDKVKELKEAS